ncbi:GNAT family N-acetyltransferase [Carboxylicivirga sp. N1Y90]|uniref:GNAT family N-acetyltransferase n=1 Tax=Carboxylicivirga fragile TaxID=3417571 RepID=UPI003D349551|nr:GNAT family N-acetyltransferase [Marinilabiliaceae bacterium N1Y90]
MREATNADKALIINILTEAFENNKSVNYVVKGKKGRIALMNYAFEVCHRWGKVYISDNEKAVALVLLPHLKKLSLYAIYLDIVLAIKGIGISRITKVLKRENQIKKHHPNTPFVYFWFMAVDKNHQGLGLGSHLLSEKIKAHSDLPLYLETSTLRNLPLYERMGFNTYLTLDIGGTVYMMRRNSVSEE